MQRILVSACLLGERVRYDGRDSAPDGDLLRVWKREGRLVSICPEVTGGLGIPRPPAEIQLGTGADVLDGRAQVRTRDRDVTDAFLRGAHAALELAQAHGIRVAILKARSPSCGRARISDGTFTKTLREGDGVTAALLLRAGIAVFSDEQLDLARRHIEALEQSVV